MNKLNALLRVFFLLTAVVLLTSACGMGGAVKDDPLLSADSGPKDIFLAAKTGDVDRVRELIQAGNWDPTEMDGSAKRPLDYAIEGGNPEIVLMMIQGGADVNQSGPDGTPLQAAQAQGNEQIVQLLQQAGAR